MARCAILVGLLAVMTTPGQSHSLDDPPRRQAVAAWPGEPAALLKRLRDRDADFDNRAVEAEQRWVERVSPRAQIAAARFDARRFGQPDPESPPQDRIPADFDQPHRLRQRLTVREPALTIERLEDLETMRHPRYVAIPNRGCRWSSVGSVERVWSPETNDLHILGTPADDGLLRWGAHKIQWSCGYGLARWIESIDSVKTSDGTLTVQGRMRLMGYDDSRVELTLDRDLVIRRAVIAVPGRQGDGHSEYVVETRGTVRPEGCHAVAEVGRFRRILKPAGKPESVDQDFEVRFVAVSPRLTDLEYDQHTRIEPGPSAVTIDTRPKR